MKRITLLFIAVAMAVAGTAAGASKSPQSGPTTGPGGRLSTTISIAYQGPTGVTFAVTRSGGKANDAYKLWVANKCYANGEVVAAQYNAVTWYGGGEFPTTGKAEGFSASGTSCTAYVWEFPSSETPLPRASTTYSPSV